MSTVDDQRELTYRDREQTADAESDAAVLIGKTLRSTFEEEIGVRADDECLFEVQGEWVEFELPKMFVRVKRNAYPDLMAAFALEDVALAMSSASREVKA